jgi:hypothetical protein
VRAAAGEGLRSQTGGHQGEDSDPGGSSRRQPPELAHSGVAQCDPVLIHGQSEAAGDEIAVKAAL